MADLHAADKIEPGKPGEDDIALFDTVPFLAPNLADAPEDQLRLLFETIQLAVRLMEDTDEVKIEIRVPADDLPQIANQAERTGHTLPTTIGACPASRRRLCGAADQHAQEDRRIHPFGFGRC